MVDRIKPGFIKMTVGDSNLEIFSPFPEDDEVRRLLDERQRYRDVVGVEPKVLKVERDFEPKKKK